MAEKIGNVEDVKNLVGKKVTIYIMSEFGFPASHQVKITNVKIAPYAQYPEAITVQFRKPRQRKDRGFIVLPHRDFIIWEGWFEVNTEMFVKKEEKRGLVTQESRLCFDSQYTHTALNSVNQKPVYAQFKGGEDI